MTVAQPLPDQTEGSFGSEPVHPLTLDFLSWVAGARRSYAETMEAWRTGCPKFPIWEDALGDGLVDLDRSGGATMTQTAVVLSGRGRALLETAERGTR
jgi:hypothetical protein